MLQYTLETYIRNTFKMLALLQSWSRETESQLSEISGMSEDEDGEDVDVLRRPAREMEIHMNGILVKN